MSHKKMLQCLEDNRGAVLMANAQQPTCSTHHLDIKHFASILDWVQWDLLTLHTISTHDKGADIFSKPLGKQLFHLHCDTIMGRRIPAYAFSLLHEQVTFHDLPDVPSSDHHVSIWFP